MDGGVRAKNYGYSIIMHEFFSLMLLVHSTFK